MSYNYAMWRNLASDLFNSSDDIKSRMVRKWGVVINSNIGNYSLNDEFAISISLSLQGQAIYNKSNMVSRSPKLIQLYQQHALPLIQRYYSTVQDKCSGIYDPHYAETFRINIDEIDNPISIPVHDLEGHLLEIISIKMHDYLRQREYLNGMFLIFDVEFIGDQTVPILHLYC